MHLEVDLETVDTEPTSGIISIGAIGFDNDGIHLDKIFYKRTKPLKTDSFSFDTFLFWLDQSEEARSEFTKARKEDFLPISTALQEFSYFFKSNNFKTIWAHPAKFDIVILETMYQKLDMHIPWERNQVRDDLTILKLADIRIEKDSQSHNALVDATRQAEALIKAVKKLGVSLA